MVDYEWSATWASGDGADEVVLDAVSQCLWDCIRAFDYWRRTSIHNCQVQTCWTSSVYSAVLSVLELVSNYDGLATVTNTCMVETSAEQAHPMLVYMQTRILLLCLWFCCAHGSGMNSADKLPATLIFNIRNSAWMGLYTVNENIDLN